jgi:hypothetical protein
MPTRIGALRLIAMVGSNLLEQVDLTTIIAPPATASKADRSQKSSLSAARSNGSACTDSRAPVSSPCSAKRRDRPYQSGRSKHWLKVKNRKHPAMNRVAEALRAT